MDIKMEQTNNEIIGVKAVLDCECKRFGISVSTNFPDFVNTLSSIFASEITSIQYRDEDDDLISMGSVDEFALALKSVPCTGGILRLVLGASLHQEEDSKICTNQPCDVIKTNDKTCAETSKSVDDGDVSIEEANMKSSTLVNSMEYEKRSEVQETMEVNCIDNKDSKCTSSESRKSSIRNKIHSASKLSKDLSFVSSEVTGCIPVLPSSSVCGLDTHFTSQKPGARKVRRVSSGTTSGSTDKNDKKQGRGRQGEQKKKRKHRESSSSSSESSTSRCSSLSSSSSSSGSSGEEDYHYYKKSNKKKRKSSPSERVEKILHKCEKHITEKVAKDMDKYTQKFKEDIVNSVTSSILQKLDGAVLQSFVVPNGATPQSNEVSGASTSVKPGEQVSANRMKYQHQNVVCDHCECEIFGPRYKCGNCSDYDLCEKCEIIEGIHTPSHVFVKMHFPAALVGRRSVGGKSRPLLRANIYEEREKEREMEDLLQRKLDSVSELEKFEKRRNKMKEVEQAKEALDSRKEEWKRMKKEIKKNKKELAKKMKQQGKIMQRNKRNAVNVHKDEGFCFNDYIPKVEPKVAQEPIINNEDIKVQKNDELSSALSSLQIIQGEVTAPVDQENTSTNGVMIDDISDGNASASNEAMIDLTTDSDDVVVVHRDTVPRDLNEANQGREVLKKPDLVDFHREASVCTTGSEDFIVVSNYFDLTVPIDDKHVHEHRNNCDNCHCFDSLRTDLIESVSLNELPVDLVASVPVTSRSQPDIASVSTVNIMDQSIEMVSSVRSSPPISPESLANKESDEMLQDVNLIQAPEVFRTCITSQPIGMSNENIIINEPIPASTETILIPPEQTEEIASKPVTELPSLEEDITDNSQDVINTEQQDVVSSPAVVNTELINNIPTQQQTVDLTNPIVQSQIAQEKCILNTLSMNSFEAARAEICDLREEAIEETTPSNREIPSEDNIIRTNSAGGFSGALVGAMANIVDTVAQVVQSAKGSVKAEYRDGELEVVIPVSPRSDAMQKLFDMGFFDRQVNERLLIKYNGHIGECVGELIAGGDNQWHQTRH